MASVDKDALNGLASTTDVHAGGQSELDPFGGIFVFGIDAFPAFAKTSRSAMKNQTIDGGCRSAPARPKRLSDNGPPWGTT
jgi:hypothetical protein